MQKIGLAFLLLSIAHTALAIVDMDAQTKNLQFLPVKEGQCQLTLNDKTNGLSFSSSEFAPVADLDKPENKYLSLWKFHLGKDDNDVFSSVTPYVDADGKVFIRVLIVTESSDWARTGKQESVELFGRQIDDGRIEFQAWSNNKFESQEAGRNFVNLADFHNHKLNLKDSTPELDFNLQCQF